MERFVLSPYLPKRPVKSIIVGDAAKGLENDFAELGIHTIFGEPENGLQGALRGHIDLSVLPCKDDVYFLSAQQQSLYRILSGAGAHCLTIPEQPAADYPHDVPLNCVMIGGAIFCNTATVSGQVKQFAQEKRIQLIHTNQGYTKCSVCPLTEKALITDDSNLYTAAVRHGFDALQVQKGSIELPGYSYGLIGGCCGKIDFDKLLFIGDAKTHSDYNAIYRFTKSYGIKTISLNQNPLLDIGSFIPLTESEAFHA